MSHLARRVVARFKAPRGGFATPEITKCAADWTLYAEQRGHDLNDWKLRSKSSPEYGWVTQCIKCKLAFSIEYLNNPSSYALKTDAQAGVFFRAETLHPRDWEAVAGDCVSEAIPIARGLSLSISGLDSMPPSAIASAILGAVTQRGLGPSWTSPTNRGVLEQYAMGRALAKRTVDPNDPGFLPVILHGEFRREDQKRNYKPAGFVSFVEFAHESEIYLAKQEVVRLHQVEWFSGGKWHTANVSVKAKT